MMIGPSSKSVILPEKTPPESYDLSFHGGSQKLHNQPGYNAIGKCVQWIKSSLTA